MLLLLLAALAQDSLVVDLDPGPASSTPSGFVRLGDLLLFTADSGSVEFTDPWVARSLFATGGAAESTLELAGGPNVHTPLGVLGTRALYKRFPAAPGGPSHGVVVSDGTRSGTAELVSVPGDDIPFVSGSVVLEGRVYFGMVAEDAGSEPWVSDGTPAGTFPIADIVPGSASSDPAGWVSDGQDVYFAVNSFNPPYAAIARVDPSGLTASPWLVLSDLSLSDVGQLTVFDEQIFFVADGPQGHELWRTNGTAAGTILVKDAYPGVLGSHPGGLTVFEGSLYWSATLPPTGQLVGSYGNYLAKLTLDGELSIVGAPNLMTAEGGFAVLGERLVFSGTDDPAPGTAALWWTDGTDTGWGKVFDDPALDPLTGLSIPFQDIGTDTILLIAGDAGGSGLEPWVSDGTSDGTFLLEDVVPGPSGSVSVTSFDDWSERVGDRLFLTLDDGVHGRELHVLPLELVGDSVTQPFGAGCAGSSGVSPTTAAEGVAVTGASFDVLLAKAAPASTAQLYLSPNGALLDLGVCTGYVGAPATLVAAVGTGAAGSAGVTLTVPDTPAVVGLAAWLQWLVLDAGGALFGLGAVSNALEVIVG